MDGGEIRLAFEFDSDAPQDKLDTLLKLTERYCVVSQTLNSRPELKVELSRAWCTEGRRLRSEFSLEPSRRRPT